MNDRENTAIQFAANKIGINREKFSHRIISRRYITSPLPILGQDDELIGIDVVFENEQEMFGLGVLIGPFALVDPNDLRCWELDYAV